MDITRTYSKDLRLTSFRCGLKNPSATRKICRNNNPEPNGTNISPRKKPKIFSAPFPLGYFSFFSFHLICTPGIHSSNFSVLKVSGDRRRFLSLFLRPDRNSHPFQNERPEDQDLLTYLILCNGRRKKFWWRNTFRPHVILFDFFECEQGHKLFAFQRLVLSATTKFLQYCVKYVMSVMSLKYFRLQNNAGFLKIKRTNVCTHHTCFSFVL